MSRPTTRPDAALRRAARRFGLLAAALLLLAPGPGAAGAHPNSLSSSRLEVSGNTAVLRFRAQVLSFVEVYPELDANGDQRVDEGEVRALEPLLFEELLTAYRLFPVDAAGTAASEALGGVPISVELVAGDRDLGLGFEWGALDFEVLFQPEATLEGLELAVDLFPLTSPDHIDYTTVAWNDRPEEIVVFERWSPVQRVPSPKPRTFLPFLRTGFDHILGGWDHLAFLAALVLGALSLKDIVWLVTGFTVAHSLTLALVVTDAVDVSGHEPLIEAAIALSIAWVGADVALHAKRKRTRWIEALVFGLVHGMGFAGFLRQSLVSQDAIALPLVGFNLGVELGQLLVVAGLALVLLAARRRDEDFLAPLPLRRAGGIAIAALGLYWFFARL